MICDASGRSLQWRSATVPCLVELSVPGKGFRCCLKALGIGRELTWWQCIHSWSFFETLIPNDPLGFVFEEPQFSSDGGIPCSTCCSHLALVVTVAYQPHSCVCEHCWTDSLKKKHSSRCATLVKEVYFASLHHVQHGAQDHRQAGSPAGSNLV